MSQQSTPPPPQAATILTENHQPLNSVSTRIIFFVFLSTFLTALVVSWISIDTIHRNLRSQVESVFPAALERRVIEFDASLQANHAELATCMAKAGINADRVRQYRRNPTKLRIGLDAVLSLCENFVGAAILTSDGSVAAQAGAFDARGMVEGTAAAHPEGAPDMFTLNHSVGDSAIVARIPLEADAKSPVLLAIYDLDHYREALILSPDEGPGAIMLVDPQGRPTLLAADTDFERAPASIPIGRVLSNDSVRVNEFTRTGGEHFLAAAQRLESIDWLIVVESPFDEVFAPVLFVVKRIFLSDLAIILVFSFLAYKITAAILKPIEALSEGAARISQGDIEHEIPPYKSNDEIGLLTRAFNDMMRKLRQNQSKIEQDKLRLTEQNEELQRANEILAQLSITDGLTKLHNHRYFQDHLTREIKRLSRTGEPLAMILIDLDDYKRLNDRHGHAAGDEVLKCIASLMNDSVRESDLLARYGGEEFVILTPNTELHGAVSLAEKIRMAIEDASQIIDDSMRPVRVTISCGVAQFQGDRKEFFKAADRALYRAKEDGKNCVIAANEIPEPLA
jgi:diguanylate cyclase (GGDEF)-like protein